MVLITSVKKKKERNLELFFFFKSFCVYTTHGVPGKQEKKQGKK